MCDNVVKELEHIEKEAAIDYLDVENEMIQLDTEIEKRYIFEKNLKCIFSDSILGELEGVLLSFRDHLDEIKQEMTILQDRSLKMNI